MSKDIVLGLDLDGVLYDYHHALYTFVQCEYNYSGSFNDFWCRYFPSLDVESQKYLVSLPIPYESSVPTADVVEFLETSEHQAKSIYYITSRYDELRRITERYLRRYNFPFQDNLIITEKKDVECTIHGVTHFLDDFPKHVEPVSRVCNAYLMARIHNKDDRERFKVVHTLKEFSNLVFCS